MVTRRPDQSDPVTVTVARRVAAGREADFEHWSADLTSAATEYPGFLGAGMLRPSHVGDPWHVIFRFDSAEHLHEWEVSQQRSALLDSGQHLVEQTDMHRVTGLETWFALARSHCVRTAEMEDVPGFRCDVLPVERDVFLCLRLGVGWPDPPAAHPADLGARDRDRNLAADAQNCSPAAALAVRCCNRASGREDPTGRGLATSAEQRDPVDRRHCRKGSPGWPPDPVRGRSLSHVAFDRPARRDDRCRAERDPTRRPR